MYLKKIIIQGFKSFADNTVIDLENNIAGIVGPNGSGKSNVVDAVRWVLGEQSVKSLRGDDKMTDVIFSGSKSRKSMGVATVTLVFDNSDKYLNISYDEIEIKRRLYRDGTNEFYLNNEKCRLKDIQSLLLDSGIAKESFNIISQGKIDEILSSKPENRRIIFEEAAGVLKYKKRKEEALSKLEKTHDNMTRINDIIKELESQIEPLREQKIKAEEYFSLSDELRELEISLVSHNITNINYRFQENKNKMESLTNEILDLSTSNSSNEAKSLEYRKEINKIDEKIQNFQLKLLDQTQNVERINTRKQLVLERKKYELNSSASEEKLIKLKEEELGITNEIDVLKNDINLENVKLEEINSNINEVSNDLNLCKLKRNDLIINLNEKTKNNNLLKIKTNHLKENIESNEVFPIAVKNILSNPKLRGIKGCIGNVIEVIETYSKAISTSLGLNAANVIVDTEKEAKEAINYLKSNNLGRVTFFPLNIIKPKVIDKDTIKLINNEKGFIDVASNLVKYDILFDNIIKNQLGNVLVIDNIDNANRISKLINYKYKIVTLDGEILHVGGSLTGGNSKTRNIITDKYELENSLKALNKLETEIQILEDNINKIDYELKSYDDKIYLFNKDKILTLELIESKRKQIKEKENKINEIKNEITDINNSLNKTTETEEEKIIKEYYEAIKEKESIEYELSLLNNTKNKLTNDLEEFNHNIKKDNAIYQEKTNLLHNLEIEVNRDDVKLDNLLNTLNETYSITYEKAVSLYKLEIEPEKAATKVNSLKRKIKDLGVVNTAAKEEYERISGRYEFLIHQQEDLINAENTLLEIIDEMDEVMKKEFMSTFKIIQDNFQETFKELFKGGNAELKLTDTENLLQTGIEIEASPPGKTLKSINLLSGGEKTFTAISLLFAILKSRPVPFCILDEVEAALDEVNVDAFGKYVKKLKEKTQFILITHKKKTMEYVDILYGITMQESGVSKLVSVKLEEIK